MWLLFLLVGLVPGAASLVHKKGYCMMTGNGDPSEYHPSAGSFLKLHNEEAIVDPTAMAILQGHGYCLDIVAGGKMCCDYMQASDLVSNVMQAESLLKKCEVSWKNFISLFCDFACSPDQSLYVNATQIVKSKNGDWYNVEKTTMFLTEEYKTKYYESIKDVSMPSANMKAIVALCGSVNCDEKRLFEFMGNNPKSPFPITYTPTIPANNDTGTPTPITADKLKFCYEKETNASWLCSCQDCVSNVTCAASPAIPGPKKPFLLLGYDGPLVILLIVYLALFLVCLVHLAINLHYKRSNQTDPMTRSASIASSMSERHIEAMQSKVNKGCKRVDDVLHTLFTRWAEYAIQHPWVVIVGAAIFIAVCSAGMKFFVMTSAPIDLWSAPKSRTRMEKTKFDSTFVPFYRNTQVIVTAPKVPSFNYTVHRDDLDEPVDQEFSGIFREDIFMKIFYLQQGIMDIVAKDPKTKKDIGIKDVCFIPLSPDVMECALISPYQWFQNNETHLQLTAEVDGNFTTTYLDHLFHCVSSPLEALDGSFGNVPCIASFFGPAAVNIALGGFSDEIDSLHAKAIVMSLPLNYHDNEADNKDAEIWEQEFINYMKGFSDPDLELAFQAERSIQDELDREAGQDIFTVALSYFLMFGYVALMLGKVSCCSNSGVQLYCIRRWFIDAKISLGLAGVLFVLLSVVCSLGIFSYAGYKSTVIVMEVIPFLVLAVGVDNIFILVQALQRDIKPPGESSNEQIVRIFGDIGPSMLLSASCEIIAFACGSLSTQPAVHDFSLYASVAVCINFLLQISVFLVLLSWDRRREKAELADIMCCIKASPDIHIADGETRPRSPLYLFVSKFWVPALLGTTVVRFLVMSLFGLTFCLSIAAIPHLEIGLDQQLALPKDSYVGPYFTYLSKYLEVGAPVYFVVEQEPNLNVSELEPQNQLCGSAGCHVDSLVAMVNIYSNFSSYSRLAQPPNSWIDDYFDWLGPAGDEDSCCRYYSAKINGSYEFCPSTAPFEESCTACVDFGEYPHNRPDAEQFEKYFDWYMHDNPTLIGCTKGGHAAYGNAVNYTTRSTKGKIGSSSTNISASYFMTYHTTCRNSSDFIEAYRQARNLSDYMMKTVNATIYPYSVFYVYYEMYVDMVNQVAINLSVCIAAVFIVSFILLNFNFMAAVINTTTVLMITINMLGMMYVLGINLNPVSLVNLVMSVGISVEFCSHITRSFSLSRQPGRVDRAKEALAKTGSSVLSGIFMTKLIGISVLAFAKSQIFEIYYFKMYVCIVALGMLHGLVFLPVFLTFWGPARNTAVRLAAGGYNKIDTSGGPSEKSPLLI